MKGESGDGKFVVPEISSHPSITKVTTLQVPSKQQGQAFTTITATTYPLTTKHVVVETSKLNLLKSQVYDAISHPFQKVGNVTEPTHTTVTTLTQPTLTSKIPHVHGDQAQLDSFGGTQSLEQINKQSLTSQIQSNQQVTKLSASLSDILSTSRPINSIGIVNQGKLTAEGQTYTSHRGKAPPIDPYTAEDVRITFDPPAQGKSRCVFNKAQKQPQCTCQDKTVAGSSLTPHAALLVRPSGTIHPTVDCHGFTWSDKCCL